jgi:hypothetical protein
MARWTCPSCEREFGRTRQAHTCLPAGTVDETFAGRPAYQRAAYDAIIGHLEGIGPVHVDAVHVGVFLKRSQKFAEVRPMARSLSLELVLAHVVEDRRVARTIRIAADRVNHTIKLKTVADVDDQVRAWLSEAYLDAE